MLIITTNLLIHTKLLNFNAAQVEKNWSCIKMSQDGFPNSCIFPDILDLVANPPKKCNWDPAKLTLVPKAQCAQHKNTCLIIINGYLFGVELEHQPRRISQYSSGENIIYLSTRCRVNLEDNDIGIIGAPCILFSGCPPT
jgi:hypothetical protein